MDFQFEMPTREEIEQAAAAVLCLIGAVVLTGITRGILRTAAEHRQNQKIRQLTKRIEALEARSDT